VEEQESHTLTREGFTFPRALAVAGSVAGHEIEHPMAIVILGGLVTSTLLNLFVLPSLYLRFGKSKRALSSSS
jgi:Cu/Ag efflux pump CusA